VRMLVPLAPGGSVDVLTRALGQAFAARTGQPFVVENRPGGNTIISTEACAKAPPDGYTACVVTTSSVSINPFLFARLPYDPARDLEPVTNLARPEVALVVGAAMPVNNFQELVAYSQGHPQSLNYGSFGVGSDTHLSIEWIKRQSGARLTHVPFNGFPPMMQAFTNGDIQLMYLTLGNPGLLPQIRAGKVKALAVDSEHRLSILPDVPTLAEVGLPGLEGYTWFGMMAPKGTPREAVRRLSAEIGGILRSPSFADKTLSVLAFEPIADTPEQFAAFLARDRLVWRELVRASGARLD